MGVVRDATIEQLVQAVGGIDTSGLAKDITLQAVVNALQNLQINVNQTAANVSYNNSTSGLTATNVQGAIDEVVSAVNITTASITRASGVSSSVQLPGITRRGNVVIIHFATMLPAGTYYNLYKASPAPTEQQHCIVSFNGYNSITILSDGTIRFNNSVTTNSSQYIIGQLVYLTDD